MSKKPSYQDLEKRINDLEQQLDQHKAAAIKYQALFENFPHGITVTDRQGKILETNEAAEKILGISKEKHEQRSIDDPQWQLINPEGQKILPHELPGFTSLKENRVVTGFVMGLQKSGEATTWLDATTAPLPIENHGLIITYTDITEQTQAEKARLQEEIRYRRLFENHSDAIYLLSGTGIF